MLEDCLGHKKILFNKDGIVETFDPEGKHGLASHYNEFVEAVSDSDGGMQEKVDALNEYMEFVDNFTNSTRLTQHKRYFSTIMEEFLYRITVAEAESWGFECATTLDIPIGHFVQLDTLPNFSKTKGIDLVVYFKATINGQERNILVLGVEIKQYFDKTMLDSYTATKGFLSSHLPLSLYLALSQDNALHKKNQDAELEIVGLKADWDIFHVREQNRISTREGLGNLVQADPLRKYMDRLSSHLQGVQETGVYPMFMRSGTEGKDRIFWGHATLPEVPQS